jgi:hypothetical protein
MNENIFREELLPDEKIAWSAQPDRASLFSKSDFYLIPFSILWGGFAIFWEISVLQIVPGSEDAGIVGLVFPLFGIPFVVIGLYFMVGRFWYKSKKKEHTYYALTNKRILILTDFLGRKFQAIYLNTVPTIQKTIRSNGMGNLIFGNQSFQSSMYANSGMDLFSGFSGFSGGTAPAFYDIKDAETVYKQLITLKNVQ